jgi:hypothetical protein
MTIRQIVLTITVVAVWIFAESMRRRSAAYRRAGKAADARRMTLWMILGSLWTLCGLLTFITATSKAGFHGTGAYRLAIVVGLTLLLTFQTPGTLRRLDEIRDQNEKRRSG